MDKAEFSALVQSDRSGSLKADMQKRVERRQQWRMGKLLTALSMQAANHVRLPPGACVFAQGDTADALFQLVEGTVRQSFTAETGEAVGLGTIEPGAYFGYDALLSGVHDLTVTAETEVTLARLPLAALKPAIEGSASPFARARCPLRPRALSAAASSFVLAAPALVVAPCRPPCPRAGVAAALHHSASRCGMHARASCFLSASFPSPRLRAGACASDHQCLCRPGPASPLPPPPTAGEWLESTIKVRADRLANVLTTAEQAAASGRSESQILATMATVAAR